MSYVHDESLRARKKILPLFSLFLCRKCVNCTVPKLISQEYVFDVHIALSNIFLKTRINNLNVTKHNLGITLLLHLFFQYSKFLKLLYHWQIQCIYIMFLVMSFKLRNHTCEYLIMVVIVTFFVTSECICIVYGIKDAIE